MTGEHLRICIPVYNDWESAGLLVEQLDAVAATLGVPVSLLLVDDGSSEPPPAALPRRPAHLQSVEVLRLRRNVGHQRAIALGLTFIHEQRPCTAVVVMDADGEDAPKDIPTLFERCRREGFRSIVFAERARRSESRGFRAGYQAYKLLHRILTGRKVEVGNFSVVPWSALRRIVGISEIWNHYAAGVYKARLPVVQVPIPRARRLAGESRMNFVALVTHGLSAISVFSESVGVRMLVATSVMMGVALVALAVTIGVRLWTDLAITGWATTAAGLLGVLLVNLFLVLTLAVVFVLQSRDRDTFLPLRDYQHYLLETTTLHG
jgi:hypothetical protein